MPAGHLLAGYVGAVCSGLAAVTRGSPAPGGGNFYLEALGVIRPSLLPVLPLASSHAPRGPWDAELEAPFRVLPFRGLAWQAAPLAVSGWLFVYSHQGVSLAPRGVVIGNISHTGSFQALGG